jgi:hypothetical protein
LYLYLAVSPTAVSAALIQEEANIQKPVYFISRALREAEQRYMQMEKMAFALIIASRKLRPYFQAYTIKVLTEYPLKKVLRKLDLSGCLVNWAIELSEFDIEFISRNAIKGQVLADFVAKFTGVMEEPPLKVDLWIIHVDGSAASQSGGAGVVISTPNGEKSHSSLRLEFRVTNNEAEYEAVIAGLRIAQEMGAEHVEL